jgi:predicted XRE-type DNA-binding protein
VKFSRKRLREHHSTSSKIANSDFSDTTNRDIQFHYESRTIHMIDAERRKRLEEAGFRIGSAADFLGLSAEQHELVKIKVALSLAVRRQRHTSSLSQTQLAELIGSSQSRVAKMERGDASVSLDLIIRALVAQGMTRQELASVIAGQEAGSPAAADKQSARPASNGTARQKATKKRVQKPQTVPV